jgi:LysM repeat protein
MRRITPAVGIVGVILIVCSPFAVAGTKKTGSSPSSSTSELAEIRQMVEQQSKEIDALKEEVDRLTKLLEAREATAASTPAASPVPQEAGVPVAAPAVAALPVDSGSTHVVTKGETLTAIAKHYKITVAELEKLNKIENDRTLQIGQTLVIPTPTPASTPAAGSVSTPQEKKE